MQMASLVAQMVKNLPAMQGIWVQLLDWEDPLEKGMANKSKQSTFPSVQLNEFLPRKLTSPDQEISIIRFQKSARSESESKDAQSCPTLCGPRGLQRLRGSSVHRIFQARVLEWVAISFSKKSTQTHTVITLLTSQR